MPSQSTAAKKQSKQSRFKMFRQSKAFGLLVVVGVISIVGTGYVFFSSAAAFYPSLATCRTRGAIAQGSSGACVKTLQASLDAAVYGTVDRGIQIDRSSYCRSISKLRVDGAFGPKTKNFVKCFQNSRGIGVDGVVGNNTYTQLRNTCLRNPYVFEAYGVKCG